MAIEGSSLRRPYDAAGLFSQASRGRRPRGKRCQPVPFLLIRCWRRIGRTARRTAPTAGEQPPMSNDSELLAALRSVATATITTVLLKKGLRNVWMRGPKPLREGTPRLVGRAFTLRFVPAREDLATPESWASP